MKHFEFFHTFDRLIAIAMPRSLKEDGTPYDKISMAELLEYIEQLPIREKQVISFYYRDKLTFKEIGSIFGVVANRAFQLHHLAVRRIRQKIMLQRAAFVAECKERKVMAILKNE